jgi:hypothetical protein
MYLNRYAKEERWTRHTYHLKLYSKSTLEELGNLSAAEALFRLELEQCENLYGLDHSETIGASSQPSVFTRKQGKSVKAKRDKISARYWAS